MDRWHGLTMEDIRAIEDKTKDELDQVSRPVGWLSCWTKDYYAVALWHFDNSLFHIWGRTKELHLFWLEHVPEND